MSDLDNLLAAARAHREAGAWAAAARLYSAANEIEAGSCDIKHNLALCHFGMGAHQQALQHSQEALALKPDLWQSRLIQAKILRAAQRTEEAERALKQILKYTSLNGHALLALADIEMNEYGDPLSAAARVAPLCRTEEHGADAELTTLMAKFYDRNESDAELSDALKSFAVRQLTMPGFKYTDSALRGVGNRSGRVRVGLLSPLFCASPVYYFTIGALRLLSREVELVVFNRGTRVDWATRGFQTIAREWHNVQNLPAFSLANFIKSQNIDVLFDLGGWMDPVGLKALSAKPAPKLYKWVGGQSATTGMNVFDGFISDEQQVPDQLRPLYSEPIINIPSGYVTYEPNFDPKDIVLSQSERAKFDIGVIGNPAKISRAFLARLEFHLDDAPFTQVLFVDRRYRYSAATRRIVDGLPARQRNRLHFCAPTGHFEYLREICKPKRIVDTFPYNGGLTSLEALHLGKPIEFTSGDLFASRHTRSHNSYWGAAPKRNKAPLRRDHHKLASAIRVLLAP